MVETSNASFSVQWSSAEYLRSQAQRRNLISWTLTPALSRESVLVFTPLPLPLAPAAGGGAATAPSAARTPQAGAFAARRRGGACAARLARQAGTSSLWGTRLARSGRDRA